MAEYRGMTAIATRLCRGPYVIVLVVLTAGVGLSWFAAHTVARADSREARERFSLAASQVDSALDLEVARETDLLVATGAVLQQTPHDARRAFTRWTRDVGVLTTYPELVSVGTILPDPTGRCPTVTMVGRPWTTGSAELGTMSICAELPALEATAASGRLTNFGFATPPGRRLYGEALPIYRSVPAPRGAANRRRGLLGWTVVTVDPAVLLRRARVGAPDVRLALRSTSVEHLSFVSGPRGRGSGALSVSTRKRLSNGSQEVVSGSIQSAAITADPWAAATLLGGSSLALLVGLLVGLLRGSRERALELVAEKTGELAHLALHDGLTGLPNRILLMDRLEHALARAQRSTVPVGLLFIDLDDFKSVNDTFGHGPGDEVLRTVARRLAHGVRDCDTVGRLGGDEFIVLLDSDEPAGTPEVLARRILESLQRPIELADGTRIAVNASVGLATAHDGNPDQLLRDADIALYRAKSAGKNRYTVFAPEMQADLSDRLALTADLRTAVSQDELFLLFQPTVYLDDGRMRGVEALLRWQHPERGVISPGVFIPIAEESGTIVELGRWAITEACRQAVTWRERGVDLVMAVNVSGRQLEDPAFTGDIERILAESGMDPGRLILEVTETALIRDPACAAGLLRTLRDLGARIAIDDFGTGYSSFTYLHQLPVDTIKIDRSFVAGLGGAEGADALVGALVQLGRSLRVTTLAEGIENERQQSHLRRLGCEVGQGFLFGQPMAAGELEALLAHGTLLPDDRGRATARGRRPGVPEAAEAPIWGGPETSIWHAPEAPAREAPARGAPAREAPARVREASPLAPPGSPLPATG